jgi:hypothetical protein
MKAAWQPFAQLQTWKSWGASGSPGCSRPTHTRVMVLQRNNCGIRCSQCTHACHALETLADTYHRKHDRNERPGVS